jgi:drug/metabolite transporter (DMT)-like permease
MSRRAWSAFAAVSVLWGIPYLFIKIADDGGMPPLVLAWGRVSLGAVVLLLVAWRAGTLHGLRERGRWLLAFAVLEIAIPFPLIALGETKVASSTAAIVIASVPLIITLLVLRFEPAERVTGRRLAGLLVGFAGVAALVGVDISGNGGELLGVGAVLIAACGYASAPLILKRHLIDLDPTAVMAACLTIAAAILTPFAIVDWPSAAPKWWRLRRGRRPRLRLHGAGTRPDGDPDRRRRARPRVGHHLHQPGDRARAGDRLPR